MKIMIIVAAAAIAIAAYAGFKPAAAPQVHFATLAGESFATSDLRGKVVLVNFWATYCAECIQEMSGMVETYRKFAPRGYEVVAVAVQSDRPQQVAEFARRRALPFKMVFDMNGEVATGFGRVRVTPLSVLIDRHGRIVKRYVGEPDWAELHATVEKLLN